MSTTTQCPHHAKMMAAKTTPTSASTIMSVVQEAVTKMILTTVDEHAGHHDSSNHIMAGHDHHSKSDTGAVHDMSMSMSFHGGYKETILFDFWQTNSVIIFIISCIGLFIAAALYEGIKMGRETLIRREIMKYSSPAVERSDETARSLLNNNNNYAGASAHNAELVVDLKDSSNNHSRHVGTNEATTIPLRSRLLSSGHIIQTFLHMFQVAISYLLMLVFMTYNSWLCLSVVLGAGLGYFFFGYKRLTTIDSNEHCH